MNLVSILETPKVSSTVAFIPPKLIFVICRGIILRPPRRVSTDSRVALITPWKSCHIPGTTESGRVATSQTEPFALILLVLS